MLSLTHGDPIAKVVSGPEEGTIIYVTDDEQHCDVSTNAFVGDLSKKEYFPDKKPRQQAKNMQKLSNYLTSGTEPRNNMLPLYKKAKEQVQEKAKREIKLMAGELEPLPSKTRECVYASGQAGSGKSYQAGRYAYNYKKMFPGNKVYLISGKPSDPSIDKYVKCERIAIDEDLINNPIEINEFKNCLVIFDDDIVSNSKLQKELMSIKDRLLRLGRQNNIYMFITAHLSTDFQKTRVILAECHKFIIFPDKGNWNNTQRLLSIYLGLDAVTVALIKKLPSRWVLIHRNTPQYLLYESGAYVISDKVEKIQGAISEMIIKNPTKKISKKASPSPSPSESDYSSDEESDYDTDSASETASETESDYYSD
jgi:hypothetical protein